MRKIVLILLLLGGVIYLISWGFGYFIQQQGSKIKQQIPQDILSQLDPILLNEINMQPNIQPNEIEYKEFISPNSKLQMRYSTDWIKTQSQDLQLAFPEEQKEVYRPEILFMAQRISTKGLTQLVISKLNFVDQNIEEIIEKMRQANLKQGWTMKIINSYIQEKEATFDAVYQSSNSNNFRSKEKIIILEEKDQEPKFYLIAFIALEKEWSEFEKEAEDIISSAQLIE